MRKYPCSTMILSWAFLGMAASRLKEINTTDPTANSLLLELEVASNLAEAFDKTWHSIYWNGSRKETRVRVTKTLIKVAVLVFDHLESAIALFDELCDQQSRHPTMPLTRDWLEVRRCLETAKETLNETHAKFIDREKFNGKPRQLLLFNRTRY